MNVIIQFNTLFTCRNPPSQCVALIRAPTLNLLNLSRSTQSRGAPLKLRNLYQHVNGRPLLKRVTSGDATSTQMSTVLLQWSLKLSGPLPGRKSVQMDQLAIALETFDLRKKLSAILLGILSFRSGDFSQPKNGTKFCHGLAINLESQQFPNGWLD